MNGTRVIDDVLGSKVKLRILRKLCDDPTPKSGRELARELGYSHTYAINNLRALEDLGVLVRRRVGPSNTYEFNEKSYVVKNIISPLFVAEHNFISALASRFTEKLGNDLVKIVIFGSTARGTAIPRSDVDLILVVRSELPREELELSVADTAAEASVEFGRPVEAFVFSEKEFDTKMHEGKGMWENVRAEGIEVKVGGKVGRRVRR